MAIGISQPSIEITEGRAAAQGILLGIVVPPSSGQVHRWLACDLGDDIDDPAHGIGAVQNRGGPFGYGDLGDVIDRKLGKVDRTGILLVNRHPVDQNLHILMTESTNTDIALAASGAPLDVDPRQLPQGVGQSACPPLLDVLGRHLGNGGGQVNHLLFPGHNDLAQGKNLVRPGRHRSQQNQATDRPCKMSLHTLPPCQ